MSQQAANGSIPNKTGLKGVSKHNKKWRATIRMNGVRHRLEVHDTQKRLTRCTAMPQLGCMENLLGCAKLPT